LLHVLFGNVATVLQACNLQIKLQNINIISLIVNILINLLLIPQYGALGAGIASAISILIFNILCFWYIKKHLGINALFWLR
jgi:O-antigen/teichoic acid export membrane protein